MNETQMRIAKLDLYAFNRLLGRLDEPINEIKITLPPYPNSWIQALLMVPDEVMNEAIDDIDKVVKYDRTIN